MILRYVTRTTKALEDCDKARTAFLQETKNLEEYIKHETDKKCFNAFLAGALLSAVIIGGSLQFFASDYGQFVKEYFNGVNGL